MDTDNLSEMAYKVITKAYGIRAGFITSIWTTSGSFAVWRRHENSTYFLNMSSFPFLARSTKYLAFATKASYETSSSDCLAPEIGASCSRYKSEYMFLNGTAKLIDNLIDEPESYLDFWNLLDTVDIEEFKEKLIDLKKYIKSVINTPLSKRGKSFE